MPGPAAGTPAPALLWRIERLARVGSTNDVVRAWLREGTPEVCVAVADEQTAGRGRNGRTWTAPSGAALLCSIGFRPIWLPATRWWRLAGVVAMAMAEAGEAVAGLASGTIRLKWPNDLVIERAGSVRKLAGVLGETDGVGTADPQVVVGIGVNVAWDREAFPADLAAGMTSLSNAASPAWPGEIDRDRLLDRFLEALRERIEALRSGDFDVVAWSARQLTNGRPVRLQHPDGTVETVTAIDVDGESGALIVAGEAADEVAAGGRRRVLVGEIEHLRLDAPAMPAAGKPQGNPVGGV